jgi:hypothetical protein
MIAGLARRAAGSIRQARQPSLFFTTPRMMSSVTEVRSRGSNPDNKLDFAEPYPLLAFADDYP